MSSGERPIGAAKGKQSDTEALSQPPPPPPRPSQFKARVTNHRPFSRSEFRFLEQERKTQPSRSA